MKCDFLFWSEEVYANFNLNIILLTHLLFAQTAESYSEDSSQGCFAGMCCSSPSSGKRCCQDKGVKGANHASLNTSHRSGKYNIATGTYYTTSRTKQKTSLSKQNTTPETCWSDLVYLFDLRFLSLERKYLRLNMIESIFQILATLCG